MTREERIVTFLYYFEELTYEEIAAALDKDITGVKKTHIQALMKLKLTTTFVENLMTPPS